MKTEHRERQETEGRKEHGGGGERALVNYTEKRQGF